jgi:hypothetical protein
VSPVVRCAAFGVIVIVAMPGAGCTTKPLRAANADGTYCFSIGDSLRRKLTCTPTPIPSLAVEEAAKRFEPAPERLTVYVIRKRWGDAANRVRLNIDGGQPVVTVPNSFARLRLRAGAHQLTATWEGGSAAMAIAGQPGDVRFVELIGSVWAWGSTYRLEPGDPPVSRGRVAALRLVADVE